MGVPVVSSINAAQGVDAIAGEHLLTADSPGAYVDSVMQILGSPQERQRLSRAARNRVLDRHSWAASMQKLDGIISSVTARESE